MKVMAFVMAFYIIMTTPRFPVMLKQLVGFTDSDVSLRLKTVADQAAASSNVASLVPLRIRRSTMKRDDGPGRKTLNSFRAHHPLLIEYLRSQELVPSP